MIHKISSLPAPYNNTPYNIFINTVMFSQCYWSHPLRLFFLLLCEFIYHIYIYTYNSRLSFLSLDDWYPTWDAAIYVYEYLLKLITHFSADRIQCFSMVSRTWYQSWLASCRHSTYCSTFAIFIIRYGAFNSWPKWRNWIVHTLITIHWK